MRIASEVIQSVPLIPAKAGIQPLGPRVRGDERVCNDELSA
jgi:hypothetical protein